MIHDTTLMMVTFNRLTLTKRMLDGLYKTTHRPFNFVIVDNGSTDGTVDFLKDLQKSKNITLIFNDENKGIAIGRNQALKQSVDWKSKWHVAIDNDVEMPDGWLNECIDIMSANPKLGMFGVNMEHVEYPIVTENGKTFQLKPQGNLGTACCIYPSAVQKMVGYYNIDYAKYSMEDSDMGMRIRALSMKAGFITRMGNHFGGESENDSGNYREWKTKLHKEQEPKFKENCRAYFNGKKSLYIPYRIK